MARPTKEDRMEVISIRISEDLKARAEAAAKAEDRPLASWIRVAMERHLKGSKPIK
jgi:predicted DNA-binding protein